MNIIQILNEIKEKEVRYNEELCQDYSDIMDMLSKKISKYESIDIGDNHDYRSLGGNNYSNLGDLHDIDFDTDAVKRSKERITRERNDFACMVAKDLPFDCKVHRFNNYIEGNFAILVKRNNGTFIMIPIKPYYNRYIRHKSEYRDILNDIINILVVG